MECWPTREVMQTVGLRNPARSSTRLSPSAAVSATIKHAHQLMLNSTLSLTTIAVEAGYYDLPHFDKAFRRQIGLSPREYRTQHANDASHFLNSVFQCSRFRGGQATPLGELAGCEESLVFRP